MLKPGLLPSESRNRRPLSAIRKGREIGVAVVRGFDRKAWLKLHPNPKLEAEMIREQVDAINIGAEDAPLQGNDAVCRICEKQTQTPFIGDLVLVVHGIGQKLSQKVDSYHFTHAINGYVTIAVETYLQGGVCLCICTALLTELLTDCEEHSMSRLHPVT